MAVEIGLEYFHQARRIGELAELELFVKAMGVFRCQHKAPKSLQILVLHDDLHQPFRQALTPMCVKNEYVGEIGEGSLVRNYPGEADLFGLVIQPKA